MRKLVSIVLTVGMLILGTNVGSALAANQDTQENTIQAMLQKAYTTRAESIVQSPKINELKAFYEKNHEFDFEKNRVNQYQQMQAKLKQKITSMKSTLTITNIDLAVEQNPKVTAYEWLEYNWLGESKDLQTTGIGVNHVITLVKEGENYLIEEDSYDEGPLTKVESPSYKAPTAPSPSQAPQTDSQLTSNAIIVPQIVPGSTYYNRNAAANYSDSYATSYNSNYYNYNPDGGDCANFASQSMYAGNAYFVGNGSQGDSYWWYNNSGSTPLLKSPAPWRYCPSQINFVLNGWGTTTTLSGLQRGDLIYYDWTGDGVWDHVAIVTAFSGTTPLVNSHNTDLYHANWTLGGAARYQYVHIKDYI